MHFIIGPIIQVLLVAINFYMMGLVVYGVTTTLAFFNPKLSFHPLISKIRILLYGIYDPPLARIYALTGLRTDLSCLILYLILYFMRAVILQVTHQYI